MRTEYMEEFVTLAECLNYSKAAKKLFITQPALSRHISDIEETVGAKLLVRDTHHVSLTPAGKKLEEDFRSILQLYDSAVRDVALSTQGYSGECRMGILYYGVDEYIDPIASQLRKSHPDISIQYLSCQPPYIIEHLLEDEIDVGQFIYWDRPAATSSSARKYGFEYFGDEEKGENIERAIRFHKLGVESFIVAVGKDHPLAGRSHASIHEFADDLFIFFEGNHFHDYSRQLLGLAGVPYQEKVMPGQVDIMSLAIEETGGVCLQPHCIKHMRRENLSYIDVDEEEFCSYMCLAYRSDNNNPAIPLLIKDADKAR